QRQGTARSRGWRGVTTPPPSGGRARRRPPGGGGRRPRRRRNGWGLGGRRSRGPAPVALRGRRRCGGSCRPPLALAVLGGRRSTLVAAAAPVRVGRPPPVWKCHSVALGDPFRPHLSVQRSAGGAALFTAAEPVGVAVDGAVPRVAGG